MLSLKPHTQHLKSDSTRDVLCYVLPPVIFNGTYSLALVEMGYIDYIYLLKLPCTYIKHNYTYLFLSELMPWVFTSLSYLYNFSRTTSTTLHPTINPRLDIGGNPILSIEFSIDTVLFDE